MKAWEMRLSNKIFQSSSNSKDKIRQRAFAFVICVMFDFDKPQQSPASIYQNSFLKGEISEDIRHKVRLPSAGDMSGGSVTFPTSIGKVPCAVPDSDDLGDHRCSAEYSYAMSSSTSTSGLAT